MCVLDKYYKSQILLASLITHIAFLTEDRFCRGCDIPCTEEPLGPGVAFIAVEWDPTALHLRYQASQERVS